MYSVNRSFSSKLFDRCLDHSTEVQQGQHDFLKFSELQLGGIKTERSKMPGEDFQFTGKNDQESKNDPKVSMD